MSSKTSQSRPTSDGAPKSVRDTIARGRKFVEENAEVIKPVVGLLGAALTAFLAKRAEKKQQTSFERSHEPRPEADADLG